MTIELLEICNKVNTELQQERFALRMELIKRCFEHDRELGIDEKSLKIDPLYYNNFFDMMYDMPYYKLEEFEIKMFKIKKDYEESIGTRN